MILQKVVSYIIQVIQIIVFVFFSIFLVKRIGLEFEAGSWQYILVISLGVFLSDFLYGRYEEEFINKKLDDFFKNRFKKNDKI